MVAFQMFEEDDMAVTDPQDLADHWAVAGVKWPAPSGREASPSRDADAKVLRMNRVPDWMLFL